MFFLILGRRLVYDAVPVAPVIRMFRVDKRQLAAGRFFQTGESAAARKA